MLAFQSLIHKAATDAGMKVPPSDLLDKDSEAWNGDDYPHFMVFCNMQLGVPMQPGDHWQNAKVIAAISDDKIKTIMYREILALGFLSGGSVP